jgi:hypothetical protein
MSGEIANILRNTNFELINELKKESSLTDLANSSAFEKFVDALKPHIAELKLPYEDWQSDKNYLALLDELQNEINKHITSEDKDMWITEGKALAVGAKIAMVSGGLLLIGGGIAYYISTQQQEQKRQSESQNLGFVESTKNIGRSVKNTVVNGVIGGGEATPVQLSYIQHNLLLVVPANKLPVDLTIGQISNNDINDLILNAVRAYCFEVSDTNGTKVLNSVALSETSIDRTTENRVFVQLELSATPEITKQQNKLGIRQAIKPSSTGQVLQFKNLQSARSASESTGFYKI